MESKRQLLNDQEPISVVTANNDAEAADSKTLVTRDRDVIQRWAAKRGAEPATGEATASGPATVRVDDGGAGVRFNFPGAGRLRPISWDEWFENFEKNDLRFVYEEKTAEGRQSSRYRVIKADALPKDGLVR